MVRANWRLPGSICAVSEIEIHQVIQARLKFRPQYSRASRDSRRIVKLRFFVTAILVRNSGNIIPTRLFGMRRPGTKSVLPPDVIGREPMMGESRNQNRIQPFDPDDATGAIKRLFTEIRAKFALVPNLFRVLANAPAALEGLMSLGAALAGGTLDEKTREQLAVAES